MSITKVTLTTTGEHAAKRLNDALADWLPRVLERPVARAKVRKLVMAGSVYLNGRQMRVPSKALSPGMTIEARIDLEKLFHDSTSRDRPFELTANRVLFEDGDLIVVDKPPGLPAHPTLDETRNNLFDAVTRFLTRRDGAGRSYLGVHQRLDRDTSGVLLFTKSERVNGAVSGLFAHHQALKVYEALTVPRSNSDSRNNPSENEWTVRNQLGKLPSKSKRVRYGSVASGGRQAETFFRVMGEYPRGMRIEAIPKTGRTHQIRVHLAAIDLPVVGDPVYGVPEPRLGRQFLHASRLAFPHPFTGEQIDVVSPLPPDLAEYLARLG
jgi:23S rRNA pseudouridine1911/1915/1917 synthase